MEKDNNKKSEINSAIAAYLKHNGYNQSLLAFCKESNIDCTKESENIIENNWDRIQTNSDIKFFISEKARMVRYQQKNDDCLPKSTHLQEFNGHSGNINSVRFHPNKNQVISCSSDCTIRIWDCLSEDEVSLYSGHTDSVNDIDVDGIENHIVSASNDCTLKLWNMLEYNSPSIHTYSGHKHAVSTVRFVPHGQLIISGSRDNSIIVWDKKNENIIKILNYHQDWVKYIAISSELNLIASCSSDRTISIFSVNNFNKINTLSGHKHDVEHLAWSKPIKKSSTNNQKNSTYIFLASSSKDRSIILWNVETQDKVLVIEMQLGWKSCLIFLNSTYFLSASDDKTIKAWNINLGKCSRNIDVTNAISCLDFSEKYLKLVSGHSNFTIKTWECV